jgi:hypothetical protein
LPLLSSTGFRLFLFMGSSSFPGGRVRPPRGTERAAPGSRCIPGCQCTAAGPVRAVLRTFVTAMDALPAKGPRWGEKAVVPFANIGSISSAPRLIFVQC